MAFRAYEAEQNNLAQALTDVTRGLPEKHREGAKRNLMELTDELGPVVESYPSWHPLVAKQLHPDSPTTTPGENCGYRGIDHPVYFRSGFLACPYGMDADVIESVEALQSHELYTLRARKLKAKVYHENATPVVVSVDWGRQAMERDGTIPIRLAAGLMLEQELPGWKSAHHAETWETMRSYFLGRPCGSRSSLFLNEKTGQALKKLWQSLIQTGLFGPVNVAG